MKLGHSSRHWILIFPVSQVFTQPQAIPEARFFLLFMWANSTQVFSHIKCSKSRLCRRVTFKDVFCIRGALMFIVSGRFFPHTNRWVPQCSAYKGPDQNSVTVVSEPLSSNSPGFPKYGERQFMQFSLFWPHSLFFSFSIYSFTSHPALVDAAKQKEKETEQE